MRRRPCLSFCLAPFSIRPLALACLLGLSASALADTYTVTTEAELRQAILGVNASATASFIDVRANITLTQSLPPITNTVSIRGNGYLLNGQGQYQLFTLGDPAGLGPRILVQVSDLTLSQGLAQGASGTSGGGGGLGAGGAVQVNSRADVLLSNVSVLSSTAIGGQSASGLGGNGGGYDGGVGGLGATGAAGTGGFGAGGGSSQTATGGAGGFGGGGGAGATGGGAGGLGGGAGGTTGGGGGSALGGGIFVADGGTVSLAGGGTLQGNSVVAGVGAGDGGNGQAAGSGMFLAGSGNLQLRVSGTQTMTVADSISDSVGAGLLPASSYAKWNVLGSGSGGQPIDPANPLLGATYAKVVLAGDNHFAGNLYVQGADVAVSGTSALGTGGGVVALDDGGLYLASGLTLTQGLVIGNDGGRVGVASGTATLADNISGSGSMAKVGAGDLVLAGTSSHSGNWLVQGGNLVLDSDARLGNAALELAGGGIKYAAAFNDLRNVDIVSAGSIDNGGYNVTLSSITGWTADITGQRTLTFTGNGTTTLTGAQTGMGATSIAGGTVVGAIAGGSLFIASGATYDLGGADRTVEALTGSGNLMLGSNRFTVSIGGELPPLPNAFSGLISGTGSLDITRSWLPPGFDPTTGFNSFQSFFLGAGNTYGGGTQVETGATLRVADDSSVGSGPVVLSGGAFTSQAGSTNLNLQLAGSGGLFGNLVMNGVISGSGTLFKFGPGTLTLTNANTYVGDTIVAGLGSYLVLANPDALGSGDLRLTQGGGLRVLTNTTSLRPVQIMDGMGVVDVGTYDVQSVGGITGMAADSALRKEGTGRLLLTGDLVLPGGVDIAAGVLQVGNGGSNGSMSGDITVENGAQLVIDRAGTLNMAGNITGAGSVLVNGAGTVTFAPTQANTFLGGLTVRNGLVAASSEQGLGFGTVTLDDNGGLLLLGNIGRDVTIGANGGRLEVDGTNSFSFDGDITQNGGLFTKTGTGTLIYTGTAGNGGDVHVAEGTLQVGSGLKGNLASDVAVDAGATLIFGRDDLTQYHNVISGAGTVIKAGTGELVLTTDQIFTGTIQVQGGSLRVGLGGTSGSLAGDVALASGTALRFDRSDTSVFTGGTSGAGLLQKVGPGLLIVTGNLGHTGGTQVTSGDLQIGDGGTTGNIGGAVGLSSGTNLAINRSDTLTLNASVSGAGTLVQQGSGTTVLTGSNSQTGGVRIEAGRLGVDSDARLGGGELTMDGGMLQYEAAFNDLRALRLLAGGGGLDTNGFDVTYAQQINGSSLFTKAGAGQLTVTNLVTTSVDVAAGELRVGDGTQVGQLLGNARVDSGATLSFDHGDFTSFNGSLTGSGDVRQVGAGELLLTGDSSAFTGHTYVDSGTLRLASTLGGDLTLAAGTVLQGLGKVTGNVDASAGRVAPGYGIGTLAVGGNLLLGANSEIDIKVDADGNTDRITTGGTATLGGLLKVVPQPGDYTRPGCCTYTVLTAGVVNGTFASVGNDLVFLDTAVTYLPTSVQVSFTRNNVGFNTVSLTFNQQAVATAIDARQAVNSADPLALAIAPLTAAQARTAFDGLAGDSVLVATDASTRAAARFAQLLSVRGNRLGLASRGGEPGATLADLDTLRRGGMPVAPVPDNGMTDALHYSGPTSRIEGVWAEATTMDMSERSDSTVGSAGGHMNGNMLALGADGYWREELLLGAAAGTLDGTMSFDNRTASGTASGTFAGVYGRWDSGAGLQYKGALTGAVQQDVVKRTVVIGTSSQQSQGSLNTFSIDLTLEAGLP
ncbi:MAG TPA: autotransporter-associated beta strand repeat-containing protein, partial [Moraxellaceae bacterium]|nr:autotransporter-associated beta strand repeat-containing protein [Moraxellaceae bacterium]